MHEYSGACVCFQCHDKRRSHEVTALQARVKELEDQITLQVGTTGDGKSILITDAGFDKLMYKAALQKSEEENARLRKQIDDLTWFRDRAIERTVPGIADTTDAVYRLIQDLRKESEQMRAVVDAAREVEKIYWNFDRSMRPQIEDLKGALHKLDGENKCDCHNHERQVCDICQGVGGKDK